jgi:hypothetical protein
MSAKKKNFLKKYRGTIILVGLVMVLAASYVWLLPLIQAGQEQNGDETNPEVVRLIDVDQYSIQHILINNKEQVIELEYVPTKGYNSDGTEYETYIWNLVQPEGYNDLDQLLIRGIPTHFSSLESTKIIEREPENLSKYGLDNPSTITVTLTNGEKMTVKVGDKAPLVAARYVQVGDDPTVYTVKSYNAGKIVPFINELRTTAIFDFPATEVVALSMGRDGDKLFSARRSEDDIWLLDYPIPADTNSDTINTLIESLISLFRHTFVEENPKDLAKYHLDEPHYEFELETIKGVKRQVYLGKENKSDSTFYARFDDSNEVFKVPSATLTYIDKPLTEIMQLFTYIVNYKKVDKLTVKVKGQPDQVSIIQPHESDPSKDVFYINGREAVMKDEEGHQVWRLYYQAVIGTLLSKIDTAAQPQGEPEVTYIFELNDGTGTVVMDYIPMPDGQNYWCMKNGEYTGMIVNRREFYGKQGLMEMFENLMNHVNVANE